MDNNQLLTDLEKLEAAKEHELGTIRELRETIGERQAQGRNTTGRDTGYPKFRKGTRVRIRPDLHVDGLGRPRFPDYETSGPGTVVSNPPPGNDYYGFPLVEWENGRKSHVPETTLEKALPHNYLRATCGCVRIIRASLEVLEQGPITCGVCGEAFRTD